MKELSDENKLQIEGKLYDEVMLLIESQYNLEGVVDINKKDSTKIIFKDKMETIRGVAKVLGEFSEKNNMDKEAVKNYLLRIIENKINLNNIHNNELKEVRGIVLDYEEEK